jgi:hypothetical protein
MRNVVIDMTKDAALGVADNSENEFATELRKAAPVLAASLRDHDRRWASVQHILRKATIRLQILSGRMAACDKEGGQSHQLSLEDISIWMREQNEYLEDKVRG